MLPYCQLMRFINKNPNKLKSKNNVGLILKYLFVIENVYKLKNPNKLESKKQKVLKGFFFSN